MSPGGIRLALLLTQHMEVQALPVGAGRAGCHAEVIARILDLNGVDLQGATWQELQPGEGEQGRPMGALHGRAAMHRDREGGKCHRSHTWHVSAELVWGQTAALHGGTVLSLLQARQNTY